MDKTREMERILKVLANRRRLTILKYLSSNSGRSVGNIASHIKLSFKATSRHLSVILASDLVEREQISVTAHYRLSSPVHPILRTILTNI